MRYFFVEDYSEHAPKGKVIRHQIGVYQIARSPIGDSDVNDVIEPDLIVYNNESSEEIHIVRIDVTHRNVNGEFVPLKIRLFGEVRSEKRFFKEESSFGISSNCHWFEYDLEKDRTGTFFFNNKVKFWLTFEKVKPGRYLVFLKTEDKNDIAIPADSFGL